MFWGLILKANKRYTQVLEKPFHLSQAALDHSTGDDEPVQVMYSQEDRSYLLCTLQKGKTMQCMLDLNFAEGDKLCFLTKGNGIVHLTGFLIPENDEFGDLDDLDDEEEEEEEVDVPDLREKLKGKKEQKQKPAKGEVASNKKKPVEESDDDSDEDEMDISGAAEDDEDDDDSAEEEEDDDDDDDDEDDDEDESDEEEVAAPPKKQAKLDPQQNKKEKQNGLSNGQEKKRDKNQQQQKQENQKQQKGEAGQMQKLQGGLMYQDLKVGTGSEAKPGKKIQVYYEGKLKSNNKTFDSTKTGPGFKMTLGRGEVIKGWDIGLQGMKVGGKRKLIIPPALGYGPRGNPPVIPANSTLVFDVELKNVF